MMKIRVQDGLPFITAVLNHRGKQIELAQVLLDTGSAGTLLAVDRISGLDLKYEPDDAVHRVRGIGGAEFVYTKQIDRLSSGELEVTDFEVEIGAMEYGFEIDGIIGTDFLIQTCAVIDFARLEVRQSD